MENILPNIKERVLYLSEKLEVNKQIFFRNIDITYGNFTGKKKRTPLNSDTIKNIILKYPAVNAEWLLLGCGKPFKYPEDETPTLSTHQEQLIPLYDLNTTLSLHQLLSSNNSKIIDTIKIPNLPKCDGAIFVKGENMHPLLKSGDIILYRKSNVENIFWGEMYLLGIRVDNEEEYITLRYIQKSEKSDKYVKLVSQNKHHQVKDIKISQITSLAIVKASIRINSIL